MTPTTVTDALIHKLVTGTHAEGITAIDVAAAVEDRGRVLLVSGTDNNFETHWDLPAAPVLPGESLLDAICRSLTILGLHVAQVTNYLGHHDHDQADNLTRVFCFAVNVTDPRSCLLYTSNRPLRHRVPAGARLARRLPRGAPTRP